MRKTRLFLGTLLGATLLMAACTNENASSETPAATPESTTEQQEQPEETDKSQLTDPREIIDKRPGEYDQQVKEELDQRKREVSATENNITSPYRYLITTEDFSIFGELLKSSSLTKHVHGAGVTVLAPRNDTMEKYPKWRELLKGEQSAIDAFVSAYVIDEIFNYKEVKVKESLTNHSGETLKVTTEGGIEVNGASISTQEIATRNGMIIAMNDLYVQP